MNKHSFIRSISLVFILMCVSSVLYADQSSRTKEISDLVLNIFQSKPASYLGPVRDIVSVSACWKVIQCDEEPSVDIGKYQGYRIVFEYPILGPAIVKERVVPGAKVRQVVNGHTYIDLVLFSDSLAKLDIDEANIPWKDLTESFHSQPVYMGIEHGFHWFANTGIVFQDHIREKLRLSGGDDRLQILVDALTIVDKGNVTANSADVILQQVGEKALPYIKKAIEEHMSDNPWRQIAVLSHIPGDEATKLLQSLYKSDNQKASDVAAYAFIVQPYREAAKPQYLDMLKRGKYVCDVCRVCVQFGWKDAIPSMLKIKSNPPYWTTYRIAYEAVRLLENNPVQESLIEAEQTIIRMGSIQEDQNPSPDEIKIAKQIILNADDKQYATLVATSLAIYNAKAYTKPVQEVGLELLKSMPRKEIQREIKTLKTINETDKSNCVIKNFIEKTGL